jgi:hypothetical protein
MVSRIQVAGLLAHCVPLGSLAKLSFSFCMQRVLAFLQMVDAPSTHPLPLSVLQPQAERAAQPHTMPPHTTTNIKRRLTPKSLLTTTNNLPAKLNIE